MQNKASFIIRKTWPRPDAALVGRFKGIPTALIADAMGHGFGVVDHDIRPVWAGGSFAGPALPVETAPHDITAVHVGSKYSHPGDVIVIATGRCMKAAVLGGITTKVLSNAGIAAAVTDGVARDLPEIAANGVPCYAAGLSPGIPFKNGPGRIGLPVSLGGVAVGPGDIVVGDQDGVVVIPLCIAAYTLDAVERSRKIDLDLASGLGPDIKAPPYVDEILADTHTHFID